MTDDESLVNSPRIHANSAAYEVLSEGDKSEISEPDDADLYDEEIVPWFEITPNDSPDDRTRSTEPVIQNADEMTSATTVKNGNHHPVQDPAIYKSSLDDDPDDGNRDPSLSQVAPVQSQVIRSTKPPSLASATPQRLGNAGLTLKTRRSLNSKTKNPPISKKPLGSGLQLEFLYLVETTSGHLTELSAFKRSWACDGKSLALSADVLAAKAIVTGDFSGFGDEEPVALPSAPDYWGAFFLRQTYPDIANALFVQVQHETLRLYKDEPVPQKITGFYAGKSIDELYNLTLATNCITSSDATDYYIAYVVRQRLADQGVGDRIFVTDVTTTDNLRDCNFIATAASYKSADVVNLLSTKGGTVVIPVWQ